MPSKIYYFYQGGSLPGYGAFPAGTVVTVDTETNALLSVGPLALPPDAVPAEEPVSVQPPPLSGDIASVAPSDVPAQPAPAAAQPIPEILGG